MNKEKRRKWKKKKEEKRCNKDIIKSTVNQTCLVSRRTFNKRINTQLNTGISANLLGGPLSCGRWVWPLVARLAC